MWELLTAFIWTAFKRKENESIISQILTQPDLQESSKAQVKDIDYSPQFSYFSIFLFYIFSIFIFFIFVLPFLLILIVYITNLSID